MAHLTELQKTYVVKCLAYFMSYAETRDALREEFGVSATRDQIANYDVTSISRGPKVSRKWRELFEAERKKAMSAVDEIPISHLPHRLRLLQDGVTKSMARGNFMLAASLLEQCAKELGGAYTNQKKLQHTGAMAIASYEMTEEQANAEILALLRPVHNALED